MPKQRGRLNMDKANNGIDFSTVLGSAVHDMKNSLCLLIQSIENLGGSIAHPNSATCEHLASAHYEATRLNTGLAGLDKLPVNIDEYYIDEVVEELQAANDDYINHKNMILEVEQAADLVWYMDADLVGILLNDVLINAMRYSNKHIRLSVFVEDNYLVFKVEDDGTGYPQSMLDANSACMQNFDISQGRTGLGLFFARLIANAHTNNGLSGQIHLSNGGKFGGSVFELKLP